MEDWQEWQLRADRIAAELGEEVDGLERDFFGETETTNFRSFWPRHRDLKERVRVAPAIKLDDKLALENRLRNLGRRAYKGQEASFARSVERKDQVLARIAGLREEAAGAGSPRDLRGIRRELDTVRRDFDADQELVPADRQASWDAWREANQFVWDRLNELWTGNERELRNMLDAARQNVERGNANAARQDVRKFFQSLKAFETKQDVVTGLKDEADQLRRQAEEVEDRKQAARIAASTPSIPAGNPVHGWRSELQRNQESMTRLEDEVAQLQREFDESQSVLEQAMIRGNLVDKRKKVTELERANRALGQRIEQTEEAPLLPGV